MDTKKKTDEMLLLLLCAKASLNQDEILDVKRLASYLEAKSQILINLAYKHAVFPQLYHTFKMYLPSHPLTHILKPYYYNIVKTNMSMGLKLMQNIQYLQTHDIDILCVKGPVLSKLIYNDITLRQYGDLDILIKNKDKTKVLRLLAQEGYIPEIDLQETTKKTFFSTVNVLGFQVPKSNVFMEVHWELLSKNYAITWKESSLWHQTLQIQINQQALPTLSHNNHFIYLCVHGSKHLYERLSWICDIDRYIRTQDTLLWDEVIELSKKLGVTRMLYLSLHLAHTLLETPLPKEIYTSMRQDDVAKKLSETLIALHFSDMKTKGKSAHSFTILWHMRENIYDKLRFTLYALFTAKLDDFKWVQLPYYFSFFYPVIRPLRLAIKYLK